MSRIGFSPTTNAEPTGVADVKYSAKQLRQLSELPEFSELVIACRYRIWQTLKMGCIASFVLMAAAWWMTTASYHSESYVRVRQREDVVLSPQTSRSEDLAYFRAQSQLALSPQVLTAALTDKELRNACSFPESAEGVAWLRGLIRAEAQVGAEILSISARHQSADVSYAASSAVTKAYLNEVTSRANADRDRRRTELENAARKAEQGLAEQWSKLNEVASKLGSSDTQALSMRDQIKMQAYRDFAQQLRTAQLRRVELQAMLSDAKARAAKVEDQSRSAPQLISPAPIASTQVVTTPPMVDLQRRIADLDFRISEIQRIAAQPNTPRLDPLREQRQFYSEQLTELIEAQKQISKSKADALAALDSKRSDLQILSSRNSGSHPADQVAQIEKKIELNESECQFFQERMAEIDSISVRKQDHNGVDLEVARHSVDRQSRLADQLWSSLEELKIESQSQPRVALLQLADFPLHPDRSRRIKASVGAFGFGWLLVILGIGLIEHQSCLIRDSHTVTTISNHPVFGIDAEKLSTRGLNQYSGAAACREAAARLMLLEPNQREIPSVLVTGATSEEPLEHAALRLAIAIAGYQRRTLLIDSNFACQRLNDLLETQSQPGLLQLTDSSQQAMSHMQAMTHVIPGSHPNLDFLPSGINGETDAWIDPHTLQATLRAVRSQYDAIVIAGPAICSSGESLLVAAQADLILLSAIVGRTRWCDLATCHEKTESTSLQVAGTILLPQWFGDRGTDVDIPRLQVGTQATVRSPQSAASGNRRQPTADASTTNEEAAMQQDIAALQDELKHAVTPKASSQSVPSPTHESDSVS